MKKPLNSPDFIDMVAVTEQPQFLMKSLVLYEKTIVVNQTHHPKLFVRAGAIIFQMSRDARGVRFTAIPNSHSETGWRTLIMILNRYRSTFQVLEAIDKRNS